MLPLLAPPLEPRPIRLEIGTDPILKHQISNIAESPPDNLSAMIYIKVDIRIPEEASFAISRTKKVSSQISIGWKGHPHEDDFSQWPRCHRHHDLVWSQGEQEEKRMVRCHLPTDNLDHFVFRDQHSQSRPDFYIPEQYNRCCVLYSNEDPPSPIWLLTTTGYCRDICTKRTRYLTRWERLWGSYCCTECFGHIPGRR